MTSTPYMKVSMHTGTKPLIGNIQGKDNTKTLAGVLDAYMHAI